MIQTITYDDTQWQLVPKEMLRQLRHYTICHLMCFKDCGAPTESEIEAALSGAPTPPAQPVERKPLTRCAAGSDGDCTHKECPQLHDGEPSKSGRHCPLDCDEVNS